MRLRIQTFPPLPDFKAWFSLEVHQTPNSIREFKELLCSNIIVLKAACVSAREIQLFLDDFELLNESSFTAALRDGDLLCVKAQYSLSRRPKFGDKGIQLEDAELPPQRKRKRVREQDKANKKHKSSREKKESESPVSSSSDSSSHSSSPSSSSSSSSSSLSSSSSAISASSSSESSDSDSSPPLPQPSKPLKTLRHPRIPQGIVSASSTTKVKFAPEGPFVPPGYGKTTTHARNLRRKRLRAAQAQQRAESILQQAQASHIPTKVLSQTNATPLGERISSQTPSFIKGNGETAMVIVDEEATAGEEVEGGQEIMMASLGNKNKKRGYKKFLMAPVPKKIMFAEDGQPIATSTPTPILPPIAQSSISQSTMSKDDSSTSSKTQKPRPRLIPPSEIQERGELPPNLFVTSVDVEADLRNSNDKKGKRKNKNRETDISCDHDYSYVDENGYQAEEDVILPYGDEGREGPIGGTDHDAQTATQGTSANLAFDWSQAERLFENVSKVSQAGDLRVGQIVGWRSLDLNPQTFTPEILLIAAKVVEYSDGLSAKIQRFVRPIDRDSGFSGFLAPAGDEDSGETAVDVEEYQWADILAADWRVLRPS